MQIVNTREIAKEYRLSHWARIMRERNESGLSIKAFCAQSGIGANVFFYWQRKLREAAAQEMLAVEASGADTPNALVPRGWAEAVGNSDTPNDGGLTIRVGGAEICVKPGFDEKLLSSVCKTLSSLC